MKFKVGDRVTPLVDDSSWIAPGDQCVIIDIDTTSICIENDEGFVDCYQSGELELINEEVSK